MKSATFLLVFGLIPYTCDVPAPGNGGPGRDTVKLTLDVDGLPQLGDGYEYESWLIVDGSPVSAGRFVVDGDGEPVPAGVEVEVADAAAASAYVLTIEPSAGDDPAPSPVHILAGDFEGTTAQLSTAHPAAIGTDFADAMGEYLLATPSSGSVAEDYDQGIWWIAPTDAGMTPGLDLPLLPSGWTYEGWVVGDDGPVSTGTFTMVDEADADGAGPAAGPDGGPAFPGQDFIRPPRVLTGGMAVVSVEPVPDDSPMPFVIKPLVDAEVGDLMPPATQVMDNLAMDSLPTGAARFVLAR